MKKSHVQWLVGLTILTSVNGALVFSHSLANPVKGSRPLIPTERPAHKGQGLPGLDPAVSKTQFEALQRELAHLGAELTAVKSSVQELQASRSSENAGLDPDHRRIAFQSREEVVQALREETQAQAEGEAEAFANYQAAIESKFSGQYSDSAWASKMTDIIQAGIEGDDMGMAALVDLECKATLCRLEVEHASQMELDEFNFKLLEKVGDSLPHISSTDSVTDDRIRSVIYLSGKNTSLI